MGGYTIFEVKRAQLGISRLQLHEFVIKRLEAAVELRLLRVDWPILDAAE